MNITGEMNGVVQFVDFTATKSIVFPGDTVDIAFKIKNIDPDHATITKLGVRMWAINDSHKFIFYGTLMNEKSVSIAYGKTSNLYSFTYTVPENLQNTPDARITPIAIIVDLNDWQDQIHPISLANARYSPKIENFSLQRHVNGVPDDEGVNVLTDLKLTMDVTNPEYAQSLKLYYSDTGNADTSSQFIDLSEAIGDALVGIEDSTALITQTFNNGTDYSLMLVFGDNCEQVKAVTTLAKCFANLHLSGCETGGACFGGFSKSTEGHPMLESYFPAFFYNGINGVTNYSTDEVLTGGTWIDGKPIYRKVVEYSGTITSSTTTQTVLATMNYVDTLVHFEGIMKNRNTSSTLPLNFHQSTSSYVWVFFNGSKQFVSRSGSGFSADVAIIVYYTKTGGET